MSAARKMEPIEAAVMEPTMDGSFNEYSVQKHAWMCEGCRLVWSRKAQAEDCEQRGHVSSYQQRYVTGPIVNGKPYTERFYDRLAIRREPLVETAEALEYVEQAAADQATREEAFERSQAEYDQLLDALDEVSDQYAAALRARNLAAIAKGIYRVSLTGRERNYGVEYVDIVLSPSPAAYQSVKIAEYSGCSVGYIKTDAGTLHTWPDVEPNAPRVQAVLAAVAVLLGAADPIAYAKAYAREAKSCWRCGEPLLVGLSQQLLMGPVCFRAQYGMTQTQGVAAGLGVELVEA